MLSNWPKICHHHHPRGAGLLTAIDSIPLPCAYFFTIELRDEFFGSRFVYRNIRKIRVCSFAINFYIYIASFCIILFEIYGDFEIVFRKINLGE